MSREAEDLWRRATRNLRTAASLVEADPDSAASRAYYAAFHAVAALFVCEGKTFSTHKAVHTAVHRDLVKAGRWPAELGQAFAALVALRDTGDYGIGLHVTPEQATEAVGKAESIVGAVRSTVSEPFPEEPPAV